MWKAARSRTVFAYAALLLSVLYIAADCELQPISGQPPQFTQEPEDTFVFETDASGQPTTLTISCGTSGDPTPTVTWFRSGEEVDSSFVLESGTLSIPDITEGESASRDGIPYYCTATNTLGTIRSKTVQVYYAFFDGIAAPSVSVSVNVTAGLDVALLCDIPSASPPPVIEWWDDNGLIPDVPDMNVRYVNGSRYLVIRELTAEQISRTYRCRVTNAFVHTTVNSIGNYTLTDLGGNFPDDNLIIYKELETEVTAFVGDAVEVSFVSAIRSTIFVYDYLLDDSVSGISPQRPYGEIEEVMLPDGGGFTSTIRLTVISDVGPPVIRTATLTVYEAAVITAHSPDDLDQFMGDSVTLSCTVAGTPSPTVEWYFNGEVLASGNGLTINGGTIDIPSPTTDHSGMYQCFVSNIANEVCESIALQVREPDTPVITWISPPGNDRCRDVPTYVRPAGDTLTLSVDVTADPCPEVEWRVDGRTLAEVEESAGCTTTFYTTNSCSDFPDPATGSYTFTIAISNVSDCTAGRYTITLSNRAGTVTSDPVFVTPEVPVRVMGVQIQNAMCLRDSMNATIFCEVEGYPYPGIAFEKNNRPLMPESGRVTVTDCMMVVLTPVMLSDEGLYGCTAENVANGETTTLTSDLIMLQYCTLPQVVSLVPPSSPVEGQDIVFTCSASGTPPPEFTWLKDGVVLSDVNERVTISSNVLMRVSQLEITSVIPEDSGAYTCIATNPAGVARRVTGVEINHRPVITGVSPPGNDRCRDIPTYVRPAGDTLTLSVDVTADPCPEVVWRVDGRNLTEVEESAGCNMTFYTTNSCSDFPDQATGSYTFTIAISNVSDCTVGRYTITLSNRAGDVTSDPVFVTPEVPVGVVGVQIQNAMCLQDSMNATIFCEVEGYPYPGITFGKDNRQLMPESGRVTVTDCMMVVLTPVMISDEGLYSCTAENVANGETTTLISDASELVYCTLPQVVSLIPPSSPIEGEDIVFTCSASGTPPPEFTWLKDGVVLSDDDDDRVTISSNVLMRESQLEITSVIPADSGLYTCNVSNPAGVAVSMTRVAVNMTRVTVSTEEVTEPGIVTNGAEEVTEPGIVTNGGLRTDAAVRTTILLSFITAGLLVLHSATPRM